MMKKKKLNLYIACISIGLIFGLVINQTSATLVWEEDFENPPFDDWSLYGYDTVGPWQSANCPPIIANGAMTTHISQGKQAIAIHTSLVAYGTWSFDFDIPEDQESLFSIMFIANNYGGGNLNFTGKTYSEISYDMVCYIIYIKSGTEGGDWVNDYSITLKIWIGNSSLYLNLAEYILSSSLIGTHHMTITRNSTQGEFQINLDSERIIRVTNNIIKTSEILEFSTFYGEVSIDNLTVCDSVGPCLPTPTTTTITLPVTTTTTTSTTVGTTEDTTPTTTSEDQTTGIHLEVTLLIVMVSMFFNRKRKQKA